VLHELAGMEVRLLYVLFPHLAGLVLDLVEDLGDRVRITARTGSGMVACRGCGTSSARVHDRYRRRLQDLSCGGRPVQVELEVRRFICGNTACGVATFAEQVEGVAQRRQRRTPGLRAVLERVALALAGRAGARLAAALGVAVSRCTLLRLIRTLPDPEIGQVTVLGVDEFAKRKGQNYATILIDLDTHRPVDVLDGREAQAFADWLIAHPGVQTVCRDRAGGYAEGARLGAPDARHCADRWHLFQNLCEAAGKTIRAHSADLREPAADEAGSKRSVPSVMELTRRRHAEIHDLLAQGHNQTEICHILGLSEGTVRKFRRATTLDELLLDGKREPTDLQSFIPYLRKRVLQDGCNNAGQLCRELRDQGYQGSIRTVRRYVAPLRDELVSTESQDASRPTPARRADPTSSR
jgi:hypothetical protein